MVVSLFAAKFFIREWIESKFAFEGLGVLCFV